MTATRTVSLHGNRYEVDPSLVGRRVQLVYDPVDLSSVAVVDGDVAAGQATPAVLATHVDPKLRNAGQAQPGPATSIAYLDAVVADHAETLRGDTSYLPPDLEQEHRP